MKDIVNEDKVIVADDDDDDYHDDSDGPALLSAGIQSIRVAKALKAAAATIYLSDICIL